RSVTGVGAAPGTVLAAQSAGLTDGNEYRHPIEEGCLYLRMASVPRRKSASASDDALPRVRTARSPRVSGITPFGGRCSGRVDTVGRCDSPSCPVPRESARG